MICGVVLFNIFMFRHHVKKLEYALRKIAGNYSIDFTLGDGIQTADYWFAGGDNIDFYFINTASVSSKTIVNANFFRKNLRLQ